MLSEEGAEAAAEAQDIDQGFFTGNIINFERPKFDSRQENRLEALKAFKKMWLHLQRKSCEYFE